MILGIALILALVSVNALAGYWCGNCAYRLWQKPEMRVNTVIRTTCVAIIAGSADFIVIMLITQMIRAG